MSGCSLELTVSMVNESALPSSPSSHSRQRPAIAKGSPDAMSTRQRTDLPVSLFGS